MFTNVSSSADDLSSYDRVALLWAEYIDDSAKSWVAGHNPGNMPP